MKNWIKTITAGIFGFAAFGIASANADYRYDDCRDAHDRRARAVDCDYAAGDRVRERSRSSATIAVTFGDRRGDPRYYDNGYRARRDRVVSRQVLGTRFRARIVVKEEIRYRRRGSRLVCTVTPRGPEADYVPYRRLKRVARNYCSPRARVRIYA